jgi:hypothetical protein
MTEQSPNSLPDGSHDRLPMHPEDRVDEIVALEDDFARGTVHGPGLSGNEREKVDKILDGSWNLPAVEAPPKKSREYREEAKRANEIEGLENKYNSDAYDARAGLHEPADLRIIEQAVLAEAGIPRPNKPGNR